MSKEPRIPVRIQTIVGACRGGQTLCPTKRHSEVGDEYLYWLEPSGRSVGTKSAAEAISRGLLIPSGDGLFGDSQTFRAA
jgi:hypothetical protein